MNMQMRREALTKPELERLCLSYLRMLPRSQHIARVVVAARSRSQRNWTVIEIDPPLPAATDNEARNALTELQGEFRFVE